MIRVILTLYFLGIFSVQVSGQRPYNIEKSEFFNVVPILIGNNSFTKIEKELSTDDVGGFLNRAIVKLEGGDFREALSDLNLSIRANPDHGILYYYRGITYLQLGKIEQAENDLTKAISLDNLLFDARIELGSLQLYMGNSNDARKNFEVIKNAFPENPISYYYLGKLEMEEYFRYYKDIKSDQLDQSKQYLLHALELDPTFVLAQFQLGILNLYQQHPKDAIKRFSLAIKSDSMFARAYLGLGYAYLQDNELVKCLESWEKLILLNPKETQYLTLVAYMNVELHQYEEAIKYFSTLLTIKNLKADEFDHRDAVNSKILDLQYGITLYSERRESLDPYLKIQLDESLCDLLYKKNIEAKEAALRAIGFSKDISLSYFFLAMANEYLSEFSLAIKNYGKAIALDTTLIDAYKKRGLLFYINNEPEKAKSDFNHMIRIDSQLLLGYRYRAMAKMQNHEYREALLDYKIFFEYDSLRPDALYEIGYCKEQLGDIGAAFNAYSKSMKLLEYTNSVILVKAMNGVARISLAKSDTSRAMKLVNTVIEMDMDNDDARTLKSSIHIQRAEWQEAMYHLNQAINYGDVSIKSLIMRGKLLVSLEYFDEAIIDLTRVIENKPENGEAYYYRAIAFAKKRKKKSGREDLAMSKSLEFVLKEWDLPFPQPELFKE